MAVKTAPDKLAPVKTALLKLVLVKIDPEKLTPDKFKPLKLNPVKSRLDKLLPTKELKAGNCASGPTNTPSTTDQPEGKIGEPITPEEIT